MISKHSAKEIAQAYRRRWDIEVFFRFLKQELNVSHLVSLNTNAIQVVSVHDADRCYDGT
jgi:IS4 transposase